LLDQVIGFKHQLSQRELDCLIWASRGKTYKEISIIMELSWGTIKTYLDHARYKLDAVNLTQAVAIAVRRGIIP
jgi:DNA-binding CsgD family transcriptional regulator